MLNQAVKRNADRFPDDFMFQLTDEEFRDWRSQIVMSNSEKMGMRRNPFVFSELGVAMLSSVLGSKTAIQINIGIMRAFVAIRQLALSPPANKLSTLLLIVLGSFASCGDKDTDKDRLLEFGLYEEPYLLPD